MTNYISLERSRLLIDIVPLFVVKKLYRSSNRLIYDKRPPQNIYTITGALIFDTKIIFVSFFPITCFSNHHILYIIWKLIISKFILWITVLKSDNCVYHRNGTLKSFSGLLPFSGGVHIQMYYGLLESQLFVIWQNTYHWKGLIVSKIPYLVVHFVIRVLVERRKIDTFVTETCIKKIQWGWMAPGGCLVSNA